MTLSNVMWSKQLFILKTHFQLKTWHMQVMLLTKMIPLFLYVCVENIRSFFDSLLLSCFEESGEREEAEREEVIGLIYFFNDAINT